MRTRSGYSTYYMRHWLILLWCSRSLTSCPLPLSMLHPRGIHHNTCSKVIYLPQWMSLILILGIFLLHNFFYHESHLCISLLSNSFSRLLAVMCYEMLSIFLFFLLIILSTHKRSFMIYHIDMTLITRIHDKAYNYSYIIWKIVEHFNRLLHYKLWDRHKSTVHKLSVKYISSRLI